MICILFQKQVGGPALPSFLGETPSIYNLVFGSNDVKGFDDYLDVRSFLRAVEEDEVLWAVGNFAPESVEVPLGMPAVIPASGGRYNLLLPKEGSWRCGLALFQLLEELRLRTKTPPEEAVFWLHPDRVPQVVTLPLLL